MSTDSAGARPLDLTKRNPNSSVFMSQEYGPPSSGILGLCLEMTGRRQYGDPTRQLNPLAGSSLPALDSSLPVSGISRALLAEDPWGASLGTLSNSAGNMATWQGIDVFQAALLNLEAGSSSAVGAFPLADLGCLYVPSILAGAGDGVSYHSVDDSNDGPRHYVSSEAMARGVGSSGSSSASSSAGERPPQESAGNLLWFLAAALGVYPLLRGRSSNRPAFG